LLYNTNKYIFDHYLILKGGWSGLWWRSVHVNFNMVLKKSKTL